MKIIAIANQKGGVGKTTTAVNLGTALELSGKRVLLIDLDPQANMSAYLGFEDDDKATMSDLVMTTANNFTMGAQKREMPSCMMQAAQRESVLKFILSDKAIQEYDYVIIDCLPSLGILLINALTASDGVIIPVQTQKFALDGLDMLSEIYNQVKETINPKLDITGVLATMADNTNISRSVVEKLTERYGNKMLCTQIHKSVEAANSSERMKSLCLNKTKLGEEYKALATEIMSRT